MRGGAAVGDGVSEIIIRIFYFLVWVDAASVFCAAAGPNEDVMDPERENTAF